MAGTSGILSADISTSDPRGSFRQLCVCVCVRERARARCLSAARRADECAPRALLSPERAHTRTCTADGARCARTAPACIHHPPAPPGACRPLRRCPRACSAGQQPVPRPPHTPALQGRQRPAGRRRLAAASSTGARPPVPSRCAGPARRLPSLPARPGPWRVSGRRTRTHGCRSHGEASTGRICRAPASPKLRGPAPRCRRSVRAGGEHRARLSPSAPAARSRTASPAAHSTGAWRACS